MRLTYPARIRDHVLRRLVGRGPEAAAVRRNLARPAG